MTTTSGSARPHVVVIAGPNGSGKSSLTADLRAFCVLPDTYINADDMARSLPETVVTDRDRIAFRRARDEREACFERGVDFAFETVLSHPSTLLSMERWRKAGYRVTLYYVTTDDPETNLERVRRRILIGGHAVPEDKIAGRYVRCHQLFPRVVETADEAYIYDASGIPATLAFERVDGVLAPLPGLTPWAEEHLLRPLRERSADRVHVEADRAAVGARLTLPDEEAGIYAGPVRHRYRHYLLQTQEGRATPEVWVRHDLALLATDLPRLAGDPSVTLIYQSGWAAHPA